MSGARKRLWIGLCVAVVTLVSPAAGATECQTDGECADWYPAEVAPEEEADFDRCHIKLCLYPFFWECYAYADPERPQCCWTDGECDDDNACTLSTCSEPVDIGGGVWYHICDNRLDQDFDEINDCCFSHGDCDDADQDTWDHCSPFSDTCVYTPWDETCFPPFLGACDDQDVCTEEVCCMGPGDPHATCQEALQCANIPIAECCVSDEDCDDADAGTVDVCDEATNHCYYPPTAEFCGTGGNTTCDDGLSCNTDVCCTGAAAPNADCVAAELCVHLDLCNTTLQPSEEFCNDGECTAQGCVYAPEPRPDCCDDDDLCVPSSDCVTTTCDSEIHECTAEVWTEDCCFLEEHCEEDLDPCIATSCDLVRNLCVPEDLSLSYQCCAQAQTPSAECTDNEVCTVDSCENDGEDNLLCDWNPVPGCCSAGPAYPCHDDEVQCTTESCAANNVCQLDPESSCLATLPYRMSFPAGYYHEASGFTYYTGEYTSLADIGWVRSWNGNPSSGGLWPSTEGEVSPNGHLAFEEPQWGYAGALGCVSTPKLDTRSFGDASVMLRFAAGHNPLNSNLVTFTVRAKTGIGENWSGATVLLTHEFTTDVPEKPLPAQIDSSVLNSDQTRLAFCVNIPHAGDLTSMTIDDVLIAPGKVPDLLPIENQPLEPDEVTSEKVTLQAVDVLTGTMTFSLADAPEGMSVVSEGEPIAAEPADYWASSVGVNDVPLCGAGQPASWTVRVRAQDEYGLFDEEEFELICGERPVVQPLDTWTLYPGEDDETLIQVADDGVGAPDLELIDCPEWLDIPNPPTWNPTTGYWEWTASATDPLPDAEVCTFRVTDDSGLSTSGELPLFFPLPVLDPLADLTADQYAVTAVVGAITVVVYDGTAIAPTTVFCDEFASRLSATNWDLAGDGVTWTADLEIDLTSASNDLAPETGTYPCDLQVVDQNGLSTEVEAFDITVENHGGLLCDTMGTEDCPDLDGYGQFCNSRGYCEYERRDAEDWAKWAVTAGDPPVTQRVVTDVFIYIPAGSFYMGNDNGPANEAPRHQVTFADGYFVGRYEVTTEAFVEFLDTTNKCATLSSCVYTASAANYHIAGSATPFTIRSACAAPNGSGGWVYTESCAHHPVNRVTWKGAVQFCQWLGVERGLAADQVLPCNEAEWERAARGDGSVYLPYPWDDDPQALVDPSDLELANCTSGTASLDCLGAPTNRALRVGSFPGGASPFGCADMAGSVAEWTRDRWHSYSDAGRPDDGSAWGYAENDETYNHPVRGGGFKSPDTDIRSAARQSLPGNAATGSLEMHGIRCCARPSSPQ